MCTVDSSRQSSLRAESNTSPVCLRVMFPGMLAGRVDTEVTTASDYDSPGVSGVLLSVSVLLKVC